MRPVFEVRWLARGIALAALLALSTMAPAQQRLSSPWQPSAVEQLKLPRYCVAQFNSDIKAQGVATPVDLCGVWMNHLCPGLVQINRAADVGLDRSLRKEAVRQAQVEIEYTLRRMASNCALAPDARAAAARIRVLQTLLK
jgi:hypothetical protein